jgi:hypothetical protein
VLAGLRVSAAARPFGPDVPHPPGKIERLGGERIPEPWQEGNRKCRVFHYWQTSGSSRSNLPRRAEERRSEPCEVGLGPFLVSEDRRLASSPGGLWLTERAFGRAASCTRAAGFGGRREGMLGFGGGVPFLANGSSLMLAHLSSMRLVRPAGSGYTAGFVGDSA